MQTAPDWSALWPAKRFAEEIEGFVFEGPGFYLTDKDTMLVTPRPPNSEPTIRSVWKDKQPEGTIYRVDVYNVPFERTIFGVMAVATPRLIHVGKLKA